MPELHWEGKAALKDKIKNIPLRLLNFKPDLSCGDNSKNMIIHGDNLDAMKALLPLYRARVKCIYIDPPYNTGAAFENYNDNFPHADWLNAIYPRLQLLREFLSDDGAIFISIDDSEQAYLKIICDEIFGRNNFVGVVANVNNPKGRSDDKFLATAHEYILIYSKKIDFLTWKGFEPGKEVTKRYNKIDSDGRRYREIDLRKTGDHDLREDRPNLFYYFYYNEKTGDFFPDAKDKILEDYIQIKPIRADGKDGNWRWGIEKVKSELEGRWRWGIETAKENLSVLIPKYMPTRKIWGVMQKDYLDSREYIKPTSAWTFKDVNSERGTETFINLGFNKKDFLRPKPVGTIQRILQIATDKNSIILDAYAGSGTTAHAVINLNAKDGGSRRFILIEEKDYCETITAERVKRIGGDYKYYETGEKILEGGTINPAVTFEELANFIWYSETQTPLKKINSAQLGIYNGVAIYLLHGETNILTQETLAQLPPFDGAKIIYGAACRLGEKFLTNKKITFRQIPQDLKLS